MKGYIVSILRCVFHQLKMTVLSVLDSLPFISYFVFQELKIFVTTVSHKLYLLTVNTIQNELPHDKTNEVTVRQAKTQISLGIRPV